jgi:GxxExxY protein
VHAVRACRTRPQRRSPKALPVVYRDVRIDCGYRIDLLVEDLVIVELKAVAELQPIHEAQLLSYLKLSGRHVGLLINFNVKLLKSGIRRLVNKLPE